jgi:hypothetical protein
VDDCLECPECPQENTGFENNEASNTSGADMQAAPETTPSVIESGTDVPAAASSAAAPGFGVLFSFLGIIVAARIKR